MMSRRDFLDGLASASCMSLYPETTRRLLADCARSKPERVLPRPLRPGMRIGLVSPASHLFEPDRYRMAMERVRALGYEPRMAPSAQAVHGYLAGPDVARARDLEAMFADPEIDAVWCLRGGYGALRILSHVDFDVIRRNPKVFIGYSDITALHAAIGRLCGLVTFHGPMPGSNVGNQARDDLLRVAGTPRPAGLIAAPLAPKDPEPGVIAADSRVTTITKGKGRGLLVGGNLSLVCRLMGTPFEPDLSDAVLFLEDVGEAVYRIDGMLSQLRLSGRLTSCAGIALGRFTETEGGSQPVQLPLETVFRELLGDLGVPVVSGLRFGHVKDGATVPYGVLAELDADAGTLTVLEPAVAD
jgi:muramoyltetrapeptide carboxypeptidase